MEIWIFNHYAIGPSSIGGTRHFDLAKHLVLKGHKVKIFASSFNHQTRKEEHLQGNEKYQIKSYDGVEFIWLKTHEYQKNDHHRVLNMLSYFKIAEKIARKLDGKPDVVIGSLVHPLAAVLGYIVSKQKRSIFYFEERDLWPQTLIDLGKLNNNNPIIHILYRIEKLLYKKSKRTIVLFENAKKYVESKGISPEKVLYLPNGIDMFRLENNHMELPNELSAYFDDNKDKIKVVYTGAHGLANNLDAVLNASKNVNKNISFLFIGDGPNKEALIKRKTKENLENVHFLDPVNKELIPSILTKCDIGILPLKNSPVFKWGISPNKLFDYMANKLPVILLCDIEESPIQKADGGYVIKENFDKNLSDILNNINKEKLKILGTNGYDYVKENHNWSTLSDRLIKVIEEDVK